MFSGKTRYIGTISIHALVKRATSAGFSTVQYKSISIHALVKRATYRHRGTSECHAYFNPRPREEGDISFAPLTDNRENFNPRPREEGDHIEPAKRIYQGISIHALVKRATKEGFDKAAYKLFQSTPS